MATDNLSTIGKYEMEDWLGEAQAHGRYLEVPRPFILSPEQALDTLLAKAGYGMGPIEEGNRTKIALAHALSKPRSDTGGVQRRIDVLGRFAQDLKDCGLQRTGGAIQRWWNTRQIAMSKGNEEERRDGRERAWRDLEELNARINPDAVALTRSAEDRRMTAEGRHGNQAIHATRRRPGGGMSP